MAKKAEELRERIEATAKREPEPVAASEPTPGLPWEQIIKLQATPAKIAQKLRANDINTYEDLVKANPNAVIGILQSVYGVDYAQLMRAAEEYNNAING